MKVVSEGKVNSKAVGRQRRVRLVAGHGRVAGHLAADRTPRGAGSRRRAGPRRSGWRSPAGRRRPRRSAGARTRGPPPRVRPPSWSPSRRQLPVPRTFWQYPPGWMNSSGSDSIWSGVTDRYTRDAPGQVRAVRPAHHRPHRAPGANLAGRDVGPDGHAVGQPHLVAAGDPSGRPRGHDLGLAGMAKRHVGDGDLLAAGGPAALLDPHPERPNRSSASRMNVNSVCRRGQLVAQGGDLRAGLAGGGDGEGPGAVPDAGGGHGADCNGPAAVRGIDGRATVLVSIGPWAPPSGLASRHVGCWSLAVALVACAPPPASDAARAPAPTPSIPRRSVAAARQSS